MVIANSQTAFMPPVEYEPDDYKYNYTTVLLELRTCTINWLRGNTPDEATRGCWVKQGMEEYWPMEILKAVEIIKESGNATAIMRVANFQRETLEETWEDEEWHNTWAHSFNNMNAEEFKAYCLV